MASTHTLKALYTATTISASATASCTEWANTITYGGLATVSLSLPGSAPTTAPTITFYSGEATGVKRQFYKVAGSITSGDYPMDITCEYPASAMYINITVTNGATNTLTVEMKAQELTTI